MVTTSELFLATLNRFFTNTSHNASIYSRGMNTTFNSFYKNGMKSHNAQFIIILILTVHLCSFLRVHEPEPPLEWSVETVGDGFYLSPVSNMHVLDMVSGRTCGEGTCGEGTRGEGTCGEGTLFVQC